MRIRARTYFKFNQKGGRKGLKFIIKTHLTYQGVDEMQYLIEADKEPDYNEIHSMINTGNIIEMDRVDALRFGEKEIIFEVSVAKEEKVY